GYRPPYWTNFSGTPLKEILKRVQPSAIKAVSIPVPGGRRRRVRLPINTGSRVAKGSYRPDPLTGHRAGARICPTFLVRLDDGNIAFRNGVVVSNTAAEMGAGDYVTITDDTNAREEQHVAHTAFAVRVPGNLQQAALALGLVLPTGDLAAGWLVAFDAYVSRPFTGASNSRLLRWPVGNLHRRPNLVFGRARDPSGPSDTVADAPGTLAGRIDDFVVEQLVERDRGAAPTLLTTRSNSMSAGSAAMTLSGNYRNWRKGRLYKSDGEVLAVVAATRNGSGADVTFQRGVLTTVAAPISRETALWRLTWPPHAIASGGFGGSRNNLISVRQVDPLSRFRPENFGGGYLRVEPATPAQPVAVHAYLRLRGGRNPYFDRPIDRWGRGTFSGAFRTADTAPGGNALVTDLPFRHHDRYRPRTSSVQGLFLQVSKEIPGGFVERISWDATRPTNYAQVKVAVRIDGVPNWDAPPVARNETRLPGRLYLFDDPGADNRIRLPATRVEVRIYLTFAPRAFEEDGWKNGAVLGGLRVHYRQATRSLRREERTD
ncbi:MAG: hypothetical protein JKY65_15685, partial [Planctomycetes bacterium]|nr:hypothetical protein [Planctomycetota bacterium]